MEGSPRGDVVFLISPQTFHFRTFGHRWQFYWCRDYRGGVVLNPSLLALWFSVLAAHWDHLGALETHLDPDPTLDLVWGADRIRAGADSSHPLSCPC